MSKKEKLAKDGNKVDGRVNSGFASMSKERLAEVTRLGGASVPREKRTFSFDRELAAECGRKGALKRWGKKK